MAILLFIYGVVSYFIGVAGLLAIIFVTTGVMSFPGYGISSENFVLNFAIGFGLTALFGIQHTIMARKSFKEKWTQIIPKSVERATFVWITGVLALIIVGHWPVMSSMVWQIESPVLSMMIRALGIAGWAYLFIATFAINHFELFGLQQVFRNLKGLDPAEVSFKERMMYKIDRHPIMTGIIIGMWATPTMRADHLLFSILMTAYIIFGVSVEERSLKEALGETYLDYKKRVGSLVPVFFQK